MQAKAIIFEVIFKSGKYLKSIDISSKLLNLSKPFELSKITLFQGHIINNYPDTKPIIN